MPRQSVVRRDRSGTEQMSFSEDDQWPEPDDEYHVGYRKPLVHSLFKPGQSGNLRGKLSANFRFYSPNSPNFPKGLEGARMLVNRGGDSGVAARIEDIIAE